MTVREVASMAEDLSLGIKALDLCPKFEADGKEWRMMGIQSKNRYEWFVTHLAGMH